MQLQSSLSVYKFCTKIKKKYLVRIQQDTLRQDEINSFFFYFSFLHFLFSNEYFKTLAKAFNFNCIVFENFFSLIYVLRKCFVLIALCWSCFFFGIKLPLCPDSNPKTVSRFFNYSQRYFNFSAGIPCAESISPQGFPERK